MSLNNRLKKTNNLGFIYSDVSVLKGTPCFIGTRVPIYVVLQHVALGWSIPKLREAFPGVKSEYVSSLMMSLTDCFKREYEDKI